MSNITDVDTKVEHLDKYLSGLLSEIATTNDEGVIRIAANARWLERFAFLIRGMCASVLRQRCQHRLSGGRGRRDRDGVGIQAQMTRLAEQAGVDRRTLETDARISDTFFVGMDETRLEHIPCLAREYYVVALSAPDPHAAIRTAVEKRADSRYGLTQFRADIRHLKRVAGAAAPSVTEHIHTVRVKIPAEVGELIAELITILQKTRDEIMAEALRMLHASLTKRIARKRRVTDTRRTPAETQGDRQLELML
jgi:hypothetical protein